MPGSRSAATQPATPADDRIPFPTSDQPLSCRTDPALFAIEDVDTAEDPRAREKALAHARRACSACPVVTDCLKWALANPDLTPTGVWAATTKRARTRLRNQLAARLGPDWVGVLAERDRRRRERQHAARLAPPAVRDQALARLELELIPTRPEPYEPWCEPMTPARQAQNRAVLQAALTTPVAA
ncbi:WhiB family transcriptional regulator (plasmid) [Streptomyces sp. NBC_00708]